MNLLKGKKDPVQDSSAETKKEPVGNSFAAGYNKFKQIMGKIIMTLYHLRKVVMAVPVAYVALRMAAYNMSDLPEQVGVHVQNTGVIDKKISRYAAVIGPRGITDR